MRIVHFKVLLAIVIWHYPHTASSQGNTEVASTPPAPVTTPPGLAGGGTPEEAWPPDPWTLTTDVTSSQEGRSLLPDALEGGFSSRSSIQIGGSSREGFFSPSSFVVLPVVLNIRDSISFSFRTCASGQLLRQTGDGGDSLSLELSEDGHVVLRLTRLGVSHSATVTNSFSDNLWHLVRFNYELGTVLMAVDTFATAVANTTGFQSDFVHLNLSSKNPELIVGDGFTGCILEGAGIILGQAGAKHHAVEWGSCPLPDGRNCSGFGVDPCFSNLCGVHGVCHRRNDGYSCQCYARYVGEHCEADLGPLCDLSSHQCENNGICQEDYLGNETHCTCPFGYMGKYCQTEVSRVCSADSCQNGGLCLVTEFGVEICECPLGFSGANCETNIDDCASQPCLHGASCSDRENGFSCNCNSTGYEGERCELNIDECQQSRESTCHNGGSCFDTYGSYYCACQRGFVGTLCQIELDECLSSPCKNNGTCLDHRDSFSCSCPAGFEGEDCGVNTDDCVHVSCPANSHCVDGIQEGRCQCDAGFSGVPPNCEKIDLCRTEPCLNGATCVTHNDGYNCLCTAGFTGSNCDVNINDCVLHSCAGDSVCIDLVNDYKCSCAPGYTGYYCENNIDECTLDICVHATDCTDKDGDYECTCISGWTGKNCSVEVNECDAGPCQNGGTCLDQLNDFFCKCPLGFEGKSCEVNINECKINPCLNGGTCEDGIGNYSCICHESFVGQNCEHKYDACSSVPCLNGATCITTVGQRSYYCECVTGFEGLTCSNNINDCIGITCEEGKVCVDLVDGYECRCPPGFTGENCLTNIDECEDSPCQNGGTCTDRIANYTCSCTEGFTGHNCQDDVDECLSRPCIHGKCENHHGHFQCYCRPGYTGNLCDLEFDECLSHPCQNNGTCHNEINGYTCECQPGFTGTDCEIDIDECASQPCQNNATCIDAIAAFSCVCVPGFTDEHCATNIDECESNPCLHEGVCEDGINEYMCNCSDTGFKGENCEINIDDCELSPCQHNSTCTDLVKDYRCTCFDGYEGKDCEEDILECQSSPCHHNGTCLERSNQTLYDMGVFDSFSYETAAGFICRCLPGFTGELCEINIDECESSPCISGKCVDLINAYRCECYPGYEGFNCELEIDECVRFNPCVYGSCTDKVADYTCTCDEEYGGKNCSVLLVGCNDVTCLNGGQCEALLFDEINHDFKCHCPHGFTGRLCGNSTTISLSGSSYLIVNSADVPEYELEFRFRTTLLNGILAVGKGSTYFMLQVIDGSLNLQSSLLNEWNGIFSGNNLTNGNWQTIRLHIHESSVILGTPDANTTHPITQSEDNHSSFTTTLIGGTTPALNALTRNAPFFTGCMEDISISNKIVIPSSISYPLKINISEGCPRVAQCHPQPCHNGGTCVDLWTSYDCMCKRPYLGDTCRMNFTAATFGHENATDSLVIVPIPTSEAAAFKTHAEISMLIRTREKAGFIFLLGSFQEDVIHDGFRGSYILAELAGGNVVVRLKLGVREEHFRVHSSSLDDGVPHLLEIIRSTNSLKVLIDGTLHLNDSLHESGNLQVDVLYLGSVPSSRHVRQKRQLGAPVLNSLSTFKGTMQDIRLSNGSETLLVTIFPVEEVPGETYTLPGNQLMVNEDMRNDILRGTVSDSNCTPDPCKNDAVCHITWNDYKCDCTFGFKGKNCDELEYCVIYECPEDSTCINLEDGYECITNVTMNGQNSSMTFKSSFTGSFDDSLNASITYRTRVGGLLMSASYDNVGISTWLSDGELLVRQTNGPESLFDRYSTMDALDGDWHTVVLKFDIANIQVFMDDQPQPNSSEIIVNFREIIEHGVISLGSLSHASDAAPLRGCLGPTRIGGILLPFYSEQQLINNTAANKFLLKKKSHVTTDCQVCFEHECQNGGHCEDPSDVFECTCPAGFEGPLCEVNIDECVGNQCQNGATCVDQINGYVCSCVPGYAGEYCEEDIDECASHPCQNGGTCYNEIAHFECQCTKEYIGVTCSELKVKNCTTAKCQNGATCKNVQNALGFVDDYVCHCAFGFEGRDCENAIDFCTVEDIHCVHGTCQLSFKDKGWLCSCFDGYEGELCQEEINECMSDPCKNGASCTDKLRSYQCNCTEGWSGPQCMQDIDECLLELYPCQNDGNCVNLMGSYECVCGGHYCGQTCNLDNPCINFECRNGGTCIHLCDEKLEDNKTLASCRCASGWKGVRCSEEITISSSEFIIIIGIVAALLLLIAIVGLMVFVMMAKKKRATRGTYSPSRQEFYSPRVEMGNMMKPPPEERLI